MSIPFASVRITPDTAPTSIQRVSSSGVSWFSNSAKKPPMSEPQVLTPERPIVSPFVHHRAQAVEAPVHARVAAPHHGRAARAARPARAHEAGERAGSRRATPAAAPQWYWRG